MNAPLILTGLEQTATVCERISAEMDAAERVASGLLAELNDRENDGERYPIDLTCGCTVKLDHRHDMDCAWTERRWTLCDKHDAQGVQL